jgi:hypothetical protein
MVRALAGEIRADLLSAGAEAMDIEQSAEDMIETAILGSSPIDGVIWAAVRAICDGFGVEIDTEAPAAADEYLPYLPRKVH